MQMYIFFQAESQPCPPRAKHSTSRLTSQTATESTTRRDSEHHRTTAVKRGCKTCFLWFTCWWVPRWTQKKKIYRQRREFYELLNANWPVPLLDPLSI